ncbi:MAG: hypothetical protein AAFN70_15535, partial [Planctomycetota bacterium]
MTDSDPDTLDSPERFEVTYQNPQAIQLRFDFAADRRPEFVIRTDGTVAVDIDLPSSEFVTRLTDQSDQVAWLNSASDDASALEVVNAGLSSRLQFINPSQVFEIDGREGDDQFTTGPLANPLALIPSIIGSGGNDAIVWNANGTFGSVDATEEFLLDAESVQIFGDVEMLGVGGVRINAADELLIASQINSGDGSLVIQSQARSSDLSASVLRSAASSPQEASITLQGGDFVLGKIIAANGSVLLGDSRGHFTGTVGGIGSVTQTLGSRIETGMVIATSQGALRLDAVRNALDEVDLEATGEIRVLDSEADLLVNVNSGGMVEIQVAGNLVVDQVASLDETVRLRSVGEMIAAVNQTGLHVSGRVIDLATGVAFPNQTFAASVPSSIGTAEAPLRLSASERVNASTVSTGGDIFLESPRLVGDVSADG